MGSVIKWHPAQDGLVLCTASRSRAVSAFSASSKSEKSTLGGGSGTSWQRNRSLNAWPLNVGELLTA